LLPYRTFADNQLGFWQNNYEFIYIFISDHILQARAEVKYGQREYITDINWTHRAASAGFNTQAGLELSCPAAKYLATMTSSRRNQEVSFDFDVNGGVGGKKNRVCLLYLHSPSHHSSS